MAINIRCKCKNEFSISTKECPKCGTPTPKKRKVYKVTVRSSGRKVTRTVHNLALAQEIESKLKVDISRNEHDLTRKKSAPTLGEVWSKFLPWSKEHKKSWRTDDYYYRKHLEPLFGKRPLDNISPLEIEKLISSLKNSKNKRGKPYAPATIKHQIVLLSRLYSIADQWSLYEGPNPCKKVRMPKLNNLKTEFLTNKELLRLLEILDTWPDKMSASIIKFALHSGIRRGELFNLKWTDIDFERQTMFLRQPKGGTDQTLPLSGRAIDTLKEVPPHRNKTTWIFYGKNGEQRSNFKGPWERIRKAAGIPDDFRFHGLRHHFASALASSGVNLYVIQRLLTHKDNSTTQRYAHLTDQALRDAVNLSGVILNPGEKDG